MEQNLRLTAVDQLRGHFLVAMIVDHLLAILGPSIFILYNGKGLLWVSAAEGFIFLAGLTLGYLYVFKGYKQIASITKKLFGKAVLLYIISATLTIVFSYFFWSAPYPRTGILFFQIEPSLSTIVKESLLFRHHFGWNNILTVYMIVFSIAPVIIYLFRKKKGNAALFISFLLWLGAVCGFYSFYAFGLFEVSSWQFLFVLGIFVGARFTQLQKILAKIEKNNILRMILYLLMGGIIVGSILWPRISLFGYSICGKQVLAVGRLVLFPLWLTGTWLILKKIFKILPKQISELYAMLGRNSLFVYTLHAILLPFIMNTAAKRYSSTENTVVIIICLGILIAFTYVVEKVMHRGIENCDARRLSKG